MALGQILIGNQWHTSEKVADVCSPADDMILGEVHLATIEQITRAGGAAVEAFKKVRTRPVYQRRSFLMRVAEIISERRGEIAALISQEAAKPILAARAEVDRACITFQLAAEEALRPASEALSLELGLASIGRQAIVRQFPAGPVLGITPFNFPLNLVAHKVAPAIAAGCSIVIKPSDQCPLTATMLGEILLDAGMKHGEVAIVPTTRDLAPRLVADDRYNVITFTGSSKVGWDIKRNSGKRKTILELGGNAAVIVHGDADVPLAVKKCVEGGYTYSGQSCISVQRITVHYSRYEEFRNAYLEAVRGLVVGDPSNENTVVGPLIDETAAKRVEEWINEAVMTGGKKLCGGEREGNFVRPCVLENIPRECRIACGEVFGPVTILHAYDKLEEAITYVNDSVYGLQASIFTNEFAAIQKVFAELEVGGVLVNESTSFRTENYPYGGVKDSGLGREGVRYAMADFMEPKVLVYPG